MSVEKTLDRITIAEVPARYRMRVIIKGKVAEERWVKFPDALNEVADEMRKKHHLLELPTINSEFGKDV